MNQDAVTKYQMSPTGPGFLHYDFLARLIAAMPRPYSPFAAQRYSSKNILFAVHEHADFVIP
jgi:hypothetical protein